MDNQHDWSLRGVVTVHLTETPTNFDGYLQTPDSTPSQLYVTYTFENLNSPIGEESTQAINLD